VPQDVGIAVGVEIAGAADLPSSADGSVAGVGHTEDGYARASGSSHKPGQA
jgi:hypothetical protein